MNLVLKILLILIVLTVILLRFEIIGQPMLNMSFRYSDKKIEKIYKNAAQKPEVHYLDFENREIRYLTLITDPQKPYVVFIHGAPGSSADYTAFLKDERLFDKVNIICVDRPGYGYSGFGKAVTSLKKQAEAIQAVIKNVTDSKNIILLGHSFGGPIALRMAMEFRHNYQYIILLAPAIDPNDEKQFKIGRLAMIQPTRWITPPAWRVAADEKYTHIDELNKMLPLYSQLTIPVLHIHGTADSLVPYENMRFSERHIDKKWLETLTLDGVDHFLPWSHHDLITDRILLSSK